MLDVRDAGQADIAAADQDAAELEADVRAVADRVAEVVAVQGTVDEIVFPVELTHGAGLAERLLLIRGAFGLFACEDADISQFVAGNDRQHVLGIQLKIHGAVLGGR